MTELWCHYACHKFSIVHSTHTGRNYVEDEYSPNALSGPRAIQLFEESKSACVNSSGGRGIAVSGDFFPKGMRYSVKMYPSSVTISCSSIGYPSCWMRSGFVYFENLILLFKIYLIVFVVTNLPHFLSLWMNLYRLFCSYHPFRSYVEKIGICCTSEQISFHWKSLKIALIGYDLEIHRYLYQDRNQHIFSNLLWCSVETKTLTKTLYGFVWTAYSL